MRARSSSRARTCGLTARCPRAGRSSATRSRSRRACPACSRPATCGRARSSAWPARSATAQWRSPWPTAGSRKWHDPGRDRPPARHRGLRALRRGQDAAGRRPGHPGDGARRALRRPGLHRPGPRRPPAGVLRARRGAGGRRAGDRDGRRHAGGVRRAVRDRGQAPRAGRDRHRRLLPRRRRAARARPARPCARHAPALGHDRLALAAQRAGALRRARRRAGRHRVRRRRRARHRRARADRGGARDRRGDRPRRGRDPPATRAPASARCTSSRTGRRTSPPSTAASRARWASMFEFARRAQNRGAAELSTILAGPPPGALSMSGGFPNPQTFPTERPRRDRRAAAARRAGRGAPVRAERGHPERARVPASTARSGCRAGARSPRS